jgi:gliding motility-associated-like protein
MKKIITIIILIIIGITNLNYKAYHKNAFDLLMEINENNANLLNDGDPIPGLDFSASYKVTAVNKIDNNICSESNTIKVNPELYMYVPNVFTPNDDGLNDSFGALGYGVKEYHLIIYNRWGELIFESEEQSTQWDGTYHGQKAPVGSYVYSLDSTGYYNQDFHKEGMVSIIKV